MSTGPASDGAPLGRARRQKVKPTFDFFALIGTWVMHNSAHDAGPITWEVLSRLCGHFVSVDTKVGVS